MSLQVLRENNPVVGDLECPIDLLANQIAVTLPKDAESSKLAVSLLTPSDLFKSGTFHFAKDFIKLILTNWRSRRGRRATIATLLLILEEFCDWKESGTRVRKLFPSNPEIVPVLGSSGATITTFPNVLLGETKSTRVIYGHYSKTPVAVKLLTCWKSSRVLQENHLQVIKDHWDSLKCHNLVKILDWGKVNEIQFVVWPLCETNLAAWIDRKEFTPDVVLNVMEDISEGLRALHSLKICHGNLKPTNVFICTKTSSTSGYLKVTAKVSDYRQSRVKGTVPDTFWVPPEEKEGEKWTPSVSLEGDIYSLGMVFYFILIGGENRYTAVEILEQIDSAGRPLKELDLLQSGNHLVRWMTNGQGKRRPKVDQVLKHPWFWSASKTLKFLRDVGNLRWRRREWEEFGNKIDASYEAHFRSRFGEKFSWENYLPSETKFLRRDNFRGHQVPEEEHYQYNYSSLMSLVELIRYNLRRHENTSDWHWDWDAKENEKWKEFCTKQFGGGFCQGYCSDVGIVLFCAMATVAREPGMEELREKYLLQEYWEGREGWEDKVGGDFVQLLMGGKCEASSARKSILEEGSSDEEEIWRKRSPSFLEVLEEKLPWGTDEREKVPGTEITFGLEENSKMGSFTNSLLFKGHFETGRVEVAVKLLVTKEDTTEVEKELKLWRDFPEERPVVKLLAWGVKPRRKRKIIYVCLEMATGSLLEAVHKLEGDSERETIWEWLRQVTEGVKWLHDRDIVHGHLTPSSVLLFGGNGGASVAKLGCFVHNRLASAFSETGEDWMSPEPFQRASKPADIFSLGMLVHKCLCPYKLHPFDQNWRKVRENIKDFKIPPRELEGLNWTRQNHLGRGMMRKEPGKRPSIDQVLSHPAFWDENRVLKFLQSVVAKEPVDTHGKLDSVYKKFYKYAIDPTQTFNWKKDICPLIVPNCEKLSEYQSDSVVGLVQFFVENYEKGEIARVEQVQHFTDSFPHLITLLDCVLTALKSETEDRSEKTLLQKYFHED